MSKRDRRLLPLSDEEVFDIILGGSGGLASYREPHATHADVQRIFNENHRQQAALEAVKRKTIYFNIMVKEINKNADNTFYELLKYSRENKRKVEGTDCEDIADEWYEKFTEVMAQQILGGVKTGTIGLGQILASSPYPPEPEPEEPRSFWQRLFG